MKKTVRRVVMAALALVLVVSCSVLIYRAVQYRQGDETYAEAAQLVELPDLSAIAPAVQSPPAATAENLSAEEESQSPPPEADPGEGEPEPVTEPEEETVWVDPYAEALRDMDFTALREVNGDVLGWIVIPNTNLSYPLLQGEDNDYYLNHTWRTNYNSVGAIFLDYRNSWDLSDFNSIIYGHRMNNSSMFGQLHKYKDAAYLAEHPCVYIADDNGSHTYEIFAIYEASATTGGTYMVSFDGDAVKQAFLDYCLEQSLVDTGVVPNVWDQVVTLSTCTGNGHATRWVVQAVRRGTPPQEEPQRQEELPQEAAREEQPAPQQVLPQEVPQEGQETATEGQTAPAAEGGGQP